MCFSIDCCQGLVFNIRELNNPLATHVVLIGHIGASSFVGAVMAASIACIVWAVTILSRSN